MELISRVAGGWNVRMILGGKRRSRFFADARHGGKSAGLRAAKIYRDELLTRREPRAARPRPLLIRRGDSQWLQIRVAKPSGGTTTTEFSVARHGARKAKLLAITAWTAAAEKVRAKK